MGFIRRAWDILYDAAMGWIDDEAMTRGAAIAFYTIFALAPFVQPFSRGGTPAGIGVPVLYQLGDRDEVITPAFEAGGFYAATPAPAPSIRLSTGTKSDSASHGH